MEDSRPPAVRLVLSAGRRGVQIRKWLRQKGNAREGRAKGRLDSGNVIWKNYVLKIVFGLVFLPLYFTKHSYKKLLFGTFILLLIWKRSTHTCHMTAPFPFRLHFSLQPLTFFFFFAFLTISKRFSLPTALPTAFCFDRLTQAICIPPARQQREKKETEWDLSQKVFFVSGFTSSALWMDMHLLLKWFETLVVVVIVSLLAFVEKLTERCASYTGLVYLLVEDSPHWHEIEEKECSN